MIGGQPLPSGFIIVVNAERGGASSLSGEVLFFFMQGILLLIWGSIAICFSCRVELDKTKGSIGETQLVLVSFLLGASIMLLGENIIRVNDILSYAFAVFSYVMAWIAISLLFVLAYKQQKKET